VLKIFRKDEEGLQVSTPSTNHSSSCLDSPSAVRTIRRIVSEEVSHRDVQSQMTIEKLGGACLILSTELSLAREREQGYLETINNQKRKRGGPFTEDLRAEEDLGVLFFSPSKVTRARELQAAKEATKDDEALDRLLQAQDRAENKSQKEVEAQQRREGRAMNVRTRNAKKTLKKAQRQHQKEVKEARRQLGTASKASSTRPRKRQKTQKEPKKPDVIVIQPELEMA
jgi:hypothetical protein